MKTLANVILVLLIIVTGVPLLLIFILFYSPYSIVNYFLNRRKRKKELKEALEINNGKIFFLYREYHKHNFLSYFEKKHSEIYCIQVKNYNPENILLDYLTINNKSKSYPQLIKIDDENIIRKEHYNSFKHYVRRNNNPDHFFELIDSSIKNLEKLPYSQIQ